MKLRRLVIVENEMLRLPSSIVTLPYLEEGDLWTLKKLRFRKQGSSMISSNVECTYYTYGNMSDASMKAVLTWFHNVEIFDMSGNNLTFLPMSIKELCSLR